MSTATRVAATLEDLARVEGKAELIAGRIVHLMPTGRKPSRVASRIFRSLDDHAEAAGRGEAYADNRDSPSVRWPPAVNRSPRTPPIFSGPFSSDEMRFLDGAPTFAVEVRSENDFGDAAEAAMAAKRPITLRPVPRSSGTWTRSTNWCGSIESDSPDRPTLFAAARRPTPSPPSPAGGWPWTGSSPEQRREGQLRVP